MPWARIDDRLHTNGKIMQIDNDAFAVWVCSITYCAQNLTDGNLTERDAERLIALRSASKQVIQQLLQVCLWERSANGYVVHDYLDYNPSREEAESLKNARSEAGKQGGKRSGEVRRSKNEANASASAQAKTKQKRTPYPFPFPGTVGTNVPTGAKAPRADQAMWDALKNELGYAPADGNQDERGGWNKAISVLRSSGETADTIPELVARYRARWPDRDCTPNALAKNQALIRSPLPKPNGNGDSHHRTDSTPNRTREQIEWQEKIDLMLNRGEITMDEAYSMQNSWRTRTNAT